MYNSLVFHWAEKADCTITMSDDDLLGMMTGTLDAQKVVDHRLDITLALGLSTTYCIPERHGLIYIYNTCNTKYLVKLTRNA